MRRAGQILRRRRRAVAGCRKAQRRAVRKFCTHRAGRAPCRYRKYARARAAAVGGRGARTCGRAWPSADPEICRVRAGGHKARGRSPCAGPFARRPLCCFLCKAAAGMPAWACGRGCRRRERGRGIPLCTFCSVYCAPGRRRCASEGKKRAEKGAFQPVGHQARRLCSASEPRHRRICGHPPAGFTGRCKGLPENRVRQGRQPVCARDAAGHCQPLHRPWRRRARKTGEAGRRRMG